MNWISRWARWKKWKLIERAYCIVPSAFLFLIAKAKCFFNKELNQNITVLAYGQTPVVAIRGRERILQLQRRADLTKNLASQPHLKKFLILSIAHLLKM